MPFPLKYRKQIAPDQYPYATPTLLLPRDTLLLCTDGLTDMVDEDLIQATLDSDEDSKTICRRLVEQALEAGGHDNVTVAVARYRFP